MNTFEDKIAAYWKKHYSTQTPPPAPQLKAEIDGVELNFSGQSQADEDRRKLIFAEMNRAETSPRMRSMFARAALKAAGLDLFRSEPVKK